MNNFRKSIVLSVMALMAVSAANAAPDERLGKTDRIVVTYRADTSVNARAKILSASRMTGASMLKSASEQTVIYKLPSDMSLAQVRAAASELMNDPRVVWAEPDVRVYRKAFTPADPLFGFQWGLMTPAPGTRKGGASYAPVWNRTLGNGAVLAVLDTGVVAHPELAGRLLAGYDFVSDAETGGDGDGRDSDATDPGDYCEVNGQLVEPSSWHGTQVAGVMAAASDNTGILGVAPQSQILNVRVLGRCGGYASDVADGIRWAAGLRVSGVAPHSHGAPILNLSLASDPGVACPSYLQSAINDARAAGSAIVVAAGNEGANALGAPGNCEGVVTVAAHTDSSDLAAYSNYTPRVNISAPAGGACRTGSTGCSTSGTPTLGVEGTRGFVRNTGPVFFIGTSAAAPFVTATLGLLKSLDASLTPDELTSLITNSARPFPAGSHCAGNSQCGFGMLDAAAALQRMDEFYSPSVTLGQTSVKTTYNQPLSIKASASSRAGRMSFGFRWTQLSGPSVTIQAPNSDTLSFNTPSESGTLVFSVEAFDAAGRTANAKVEVKVTSGVPPVVANPVSLSTPAGSAWTYKPSVTVVDGPAQVLLDQGPAGMVAQGAELSWPNPVAGTHDVVFRVRDAAGVESGTTSFKLTVNATATTPAPGNGSTGGGGGGGGGAWGVLGLLLVLTAAALRRQALGRA